MDVCAELGWLQSTPTALSEPAPSVAPFPQRPLSGQAALGARGIRDALGLGWFTTLGIVHCAQDFWSEFGDPGAIIHRPELIPGVYDALRHAVNS